MDHSSIDKMIDQLWQCEYIKESDVKALCITQYQSVPIGSHDEVTLHVMADDGPLKADFDAVLEDGSGCSSALLHLVIVFLRCFC